MKNKEEKKESFLKKHWSNILFGLFVILLIIPQTRTPIQVFINKIISFSPSEISEDDRESLKTYNWVLMNERGEDINFNQSKDKVVIINYWATWCAPCIAEMPSLQELYTEFKDDVDFYFVTNDDPQKVNTFMSKNDYDMPSYRQRSQAPQILQSSSLPTTYMISKKGEIIMKKIGSANWSSDKVKNTIRENL
ncbi:TlpA family protein disulfide reductase [Psychroflexus halocasei]|uniref:Thiol-disulfide isomerase or thioredoxin n=1 Tax=Psychroflexus halocasei TaxID=908615 RepID=A0A1H4AZ71_9FLAO|nr:TlpA disulfide reductase family protein [Psychroflexus halocasei]SEA41180.1 Thiol-disulfide isomerase or thioredoxin [Psychroflexus halocasei]